MLNIFGGSLTLTGNCLDAFHLQEREREREKEGVGGRIFLEDWKTVVGTSCEIPNL